MTEKKTSYLAYFLPVRSIMFLLIFLAGAAVTDRELAGIVNWWSIVATAVNILTILLLILLAKRAGLSYSKLINYEKGRGPVRKTALLVLGFFALGMSGMYLAGLICYGKIMPAVSVKIISPIPAVLAVLNLILLPATVPFAEDGFYLGCGVNNISNKYAAVAVPAFIYALQHCFIPTLFDGRYMLYRFISFLPLTVIFCLHYRKKRDLFPIMLSHALLDLASASMILATSLVPGVYDKWLGMV
ncbi:MAG: CPBP family intramembrane metalloprotease [Ruminococcus sp.]|nr:CPBP family intramembrane metalloprotease [Ruminococcus sp.]